MLNANEHIHSPAIYASAVESIKTAILQGQYEAAKSTNRIQLALYYGVGRFLSQHTRKGVWGTGALKAISEQLQREMPGLRGFSEGHLKKMRLFYEQWNVVDSNSFIVMNELEDTEYEDDINSFITTNDLENANSAVVTAELQVVDEQVDVQSIVKIIDFDNFPIEDFFRVPFTHHFYIATSTLSLPERYYYIHRTAEEHLPVRTLRKLL